MSDPPPSSDPENSAPDAADPLSNASPAPGCIILCTILVVFGGLAILYTVVAYYQHKALGGFTDGEPVVREVMEPTPEQIATADRKAQDLFFAAGKNEMDRILFTADDLNALIATRDLLEDFRGMTFIRKITDEGIEAEMSQPLKKKIFGSGRRYLNATFVLKPELRARTVLFKVVDIRADNPERPVPDDFVTGYSTLDFFKLDPSNEDLSPVLRKLGNVYTEGDKAVAETRVEMSK